MKSEMFARSNACFRALWLTLLPVFALACSGPGSAQLQGKSGPLSADDFPDVLASWTRSEKVYGGLESKLFVSATFHAPEFRRAFAAAFPDIYGHGGNITRRELVDLSGDVEQYHNFFVSMYTADRKWNDLAKGDSIWRVSLVNAAGVTVDAEHIQPVKVDVNLRAVYPYIRDFDKAYLVRFPLADAVKDAVLSPDSKSFSLRFASALGVATMEWKLAPPPNGS